MPADSAVSVTALAMAESLMHKPSFMSMRKSFVISKGPVSIVYQAGVGREGVAMWVAQDLKARSEWRSY